MKGPFSYEKRVSPHANRWEYRVADASDDRVATCWDEENAEEIVARLNADEDKLAALMAADAVMDAAALRGIQDWLGEGPSAVWAEAHLRVRAALEKARGES